MKMAILNRGRYTGTCQRLKYFTVISLIQLSESAEAKATKKKAI